MSVKDDQREIRKLSSTLRALRGGNEGDRPARFTLTQAYGNLLEVLGLVLAKQTPRQPAEGVELTRNAKGDTQISVSGGTHEGETLAVCAERVAVLYETLRARFPVNGPEAPPEAAKPSPARRRAKAAK